MPVLTPAQIRELPEWHVLVFRRAMRAGVGVISPAWKRRDVRQAAKQRAKPTVVGAPAAVQPVEAGE